MPDLFDEVAAPAEGDVFDQVQPESGFIRSAAAQTAKTALDIYAGLQSGVGRLAGAVMTLPAQIEAGAKAQTQKEGEAAIKAEDEKLKAVGGVQMGDAATREKAASMFEAYGANPEAKNIAAQLGRGVGTAINLIPAMAGGELPLMAGALGGAADAYTNAFAATEKQMKDEGRTPEEVRDAAEKEATKAAIETAPALAAYMVGGKLAAGIASKLLPKAFSPIARAVSSGAIAGATNIGVSSALRQEAPTPESATVDLLLGGLSGLETLHGKPAEVVDQTISEVATAEPPPAPPIGEPNAAQEGVQQSRDQLQYQGTDAEQQAAKTSNRYSDVGSGQVPTETQVITAEPTTATLQTEPTPSSPEGTATEVPKVAGEAPASAESTVPLDPVQIENRIQGLMSQMLSVPNEERARYMAEAKALQDQLPKTEWSKATDPVAEPEGPKPEKEGPKLGITSPGFDLALKAAEKVANVAKEVANIQGVSDLRRSILRWSAKSQKSFGEIRAAQKEIVNTVKDPIRRAAITNYIEANGDMAELAAREAASTDLKLKKGYKAAQTLTPAEIAIAGKVRDAFDALHARGQAYGILDSFRDNYVNHVWERKPNRLTYSSKTLRDSFRFSRARTFQTFFEGEQNGFKPKTKDIAKLLPVYIHEMNSAIAARQLVQDMSNGVASDGRPLVSPRGNVKEVASDEGKAYLVSPKVPKDTDVGDYRSADQQALQKWTWKGKDEDGNPIFINADLALHPEAYERIRRLLGTSEIKRWYNSEGGQLASIPKGIVKGLDNAQSTMKQTMLGMLSTFHQVQEGTHAIGHRVSPLGFVKGGFTDTIFGGKLPGAFTIPKIDLSADPAQMDAANHGLMLDADRISEKVFMEGVGQTGIISKIPLIGKVADMYANYLFHQYIPGLKFKTYTAMVDRNAKVYAKELASGAVTPEQIKTLSAEQANAAYGHLNYADLGRDPTMQHLMQIALLAPDFLEARTRFAGQSLKGLAGLKNGREQALAVAFLAVSQFALAKIISKLGSDDKDWHFDKPFEAVVGDRTYTLRSVPEDVFSLLKDSRRFLYGRMSPLLGKGATQMITGLNYRGEKVTPMETIQELLTQYIPMSLRSLPGIRDLSATQKQRTITPLEEFAGTMGIRSARFSPIGEVYKLAGKWQEQQNIPKDKGSYPVSKYQQLRYALEDGDLEKAQAEYDKLRKDMKRDKVFDGFKESLNHPFTGSESNDLKFKRSLSEDDRHLYDLAVEKRKQIFRKFVDLKRK